MVDTDNTRRTMDADDGRWTTDDGRWTTSRVGHKLPTGELKNKWPQLCSENLVKYGSIPAKKKLTKIYELSETSTKGQMFTLGPRIISRIRGNIL